MNLAVKTRWANIITSIVAALVLFQGYLTAPPFTTEQIATWGSVVALAVFLLTALKQWLSPEVSNAAAKVTFAAVALGVLAWLGENMNLLHVGPESEQRFKFWISVGVMIVNILSKTLFPSKTQVAKMEELKHE